MPEILVQGVLDDLAARGYGDVREVRTASEKIIFSLPREVREPRVQR